MFKKIGIFLLAVVMLGGFLLGTGLVYAQETSGNYGLDETVGQIDAFKGGDPINPQTFIQSRAGQIIGFALSFVGILFLGLVIYAGLMWMTAQGAEAQVTKAKDLLINAVIGLIIVFAAYALTTFVGEFVSNELVK